MTQFVIQKVAFSYIKIGMESIDKYVLMQHRPSIDKMLKGYSLVGSCIISCISVEQKITAFPPHYWLKGECMEWYSIWYCVAYKDEYIWNYRLISPVIESRRFILIWKQPQVIWSKYLYKTEQKTSLHTNIQQYDVLERITIRGV